MDFADRRVYSRALPLLPSVTATCWTGAAGLLLYEPHASRAAPTRQWHIWNAERRHWLCAIEAPILQIHIFTSVEGAFVERYTQQSKYQEHNEAEENQVA
jgi:hypothetical protein